MRKVETLERLSQLIRIAGALGLPVQAQGYALGIPRETIIAAPSTPKRHATGRELRWRAPN
ncbi:hypothetical protein LP419_35275 [Massilia sp. H-1]|nr:hypothetical protein LP419_35275 [Massilia sp. H-1]